MFGRKRDTAKDSEQVATIIGKGAHFKGHINCASAMRIDGEIEGEFVHAQEIVVGESGIIKSSVKARNAVIGGTVNGNVEIAEKLELLPSAKVLGDIKAGTLIIGEGAIFKGACEMRFGNASEKSQQAGASPVHPPAEAAATIPTGSNKKFRDAK